MRVFLHRSKSCCALKDQHRAIHWGLIKNRQRSNLSVKGLVLIERAKIETECERSRLIYLRPERLRSSYEQYKLQKALTWCQSKRKFDSIYEKLKLIIPLRRFTKKMYPNLTLPYRINLAYIWRKKIPSHISLGVVCSYYSSEVMFMCS